MQLTRLSEFKKLGLLVVENNVCKIKVVSILVFGTTGEMTTDCKGFASASASSVTAITCSTIYCRDIGRHKFQCLPLPAGVKS